MDIRWPDKSWELVTIGGQTSHESWLLLVNSGKWFHQVRPKMPQVPDLLWQDPCTSDRATCHGTTLAFLNVGHDVIGLITTKASNGHRFIFVVIDYFTKWVEVASYASVTRSVICRFNKKEIICRYGIPKKIISDNATNLNNKKMVQIYEQFKIKHHNFTLYRPKMIGAVKAANKNVKKIMAKMTDTYKDWHEKLPFALHAYRIAVRPSTRATPFSLVYGMEAVLSIEVEILPLRVLMEAKLEQSGSKPDMTS